MSASERLAALPLAGVPWTPAEILRLAAVAQIDGIVLVLNALPEIVALVRAAEREAPFEERGGNTGDLRRAIAALDEKLTDAGS